MDTNITRLDAVAAEHLQTMPTDVLAAILRGDIGFMGLVRAELASRGVDAHGQWVGFDEAKRLHLGSD